MSVHYFISPFLFKLMQMCHRVGQIIIALIVDPLNNNNEMKQFPFFFCVVLNRQAMRLQQSIESAYDDDDDSKMQTEKNNILTLISFVRFKYVFLLFFFVLSSFVHRVTFKNMAIWIRSVELHRNRTKQHDM